MSTPFLSVLVGLCALLCCANATALDVNEFFQHAHVNNEAFYTDAPSFTVERYLQTQNQGNTQNVTWYTLTDTRANFGFDDHAYWFRLNIDNNTNKPLPLLLSLGLPTLDHVDFYLIHNNTIIDRYLTGDHHPFNTRRVNHRYPVYPMEVKANSHYQLLFRVQTAGHLQVTMEAWNPKAFWSSDQSFILAQGLFFGAMLVMMLYNLFLFFSLRDINYLIYVFFVGSAILFEIGLQGIGTQFLWGDTIMTSEWVIRTTSITFGLTASLFSMRFLGLREHLPVMHKVFLLIVAFYCAFFISDTFLYYGTTLNILTLMVAVVFTLSFACGGILWIKGFTHARFFTLAWGGILLGTVLLTLSKVGIIPTSNISEYSSQVGAVMEVVLLSFALGDRINRDRQEREYAKQQALRHAQKALENERKAMENEKLVRLEQEKIAEMAFNAEKEELRAKEEIIAAKAESKAKSLFLATMSHEIRTPMNGVLGMAQLLQTTELEPLQRQYVDVINNSGKGLLSIINDILDYSKIEAGKMDIDLLSFNVRELANECTSVFLLAAKDKNIELKTTIDPSISTRLVSDPTRVKQIILNLLSNAFKFTNKGVITLSIHNEACLLPKGASQGETPIQLRISVEDSGIGIAQNTLQRLFNAFNQADTSTTRKYGGTGLGLTISKELSQLLGGTIGVESKLGQGSTFWVSLPFKPSLDNDLDPKTNTVSDNHSNELNHESFSHLKVLVAEDNYVNRLVVEGMLGKLGITPVFAENGVQAVEAVCSANEHFDIVLMDCEMPQMDGYDATKEIRAIEAQHTLKRCTIIALTAHAFEEHQHNAALAGMDHHLTKPLDMKKLGALLQQTSQQEEEPC